jgi:hypothetical protein
MPGGLVKQFAGPPTKNRSVLSDPRRLRGCAGLYRDVRDPQIRLEGFEPPTYGSVGLTPAVSQLLWTYSLTMPASCRRVQWCDDRHPSDTTSQRSAAKGLAIGTPSCSAQRGHRNPVMHLERYHTPRCWLRRRVPAETAGFRTKQIMRPSNATLLCGPSPMFSLEVFPQLK